MATARKLPSGSWRVRQYIGEDATGKKIYKSFTASTKKEAEFAAAEYMLTRKEKTAPMQMTVGTALDRYIAARSEVLSPSTIRGYKQARKNRLQGLMSISLNELTQEKIQQEVNEDAKRYTPKTIRNAHGLLSAALGEYCRDMALRTKLPQKIRHEITVPEKPAIEKLVKATSGTILGVVISLGACLGLRRSEICALNWEDIDLVNKKIRVNKAVVQNDKKDWVLKSPKSYAGSRVLDMPDAVVFQLEQLEKESDRVVPLTPNAVAHRFDRCAKQLKLSIRLHDLRHFNASVMLALGVPDRYAMERMGHATPNMLKTVYQHTMQEKRTEVTAVVNDYFKDM